MAYTGFRSICIGILISESGNESSLKFPGDRSGLAGFIFCECDETTINRQNKIRIPFPFMLDIDGQK